MKKPFRLVALLVAVCLAAPWVFPVGTAAVAPASATTHTASSSDEFHRALTAAQDGDVIQLTGSFVLKNPQSNNDSLVIDKAVTIRGGSMMLWYAGILLGADVTFQDITLGLGANVRPAIMANGHTLTLENVQRDPTARYIHLFCGGQTGATQGDLSAAKQGGHGQIILKGNTNLGLANIYAGSISTDGTNNEFTKPATVTIDETVKGQPIEHIYACGALQTYTSENDWFDYEHEINPPFASPGNFQVRGTVTFNLYGTAAKRVSGDTGVGGNLAQVNYKGTDYLNDSLLLSSIGGLKVESGSLAPAAGQLVQENVSTADRTAEIVPVSGGSFFGNNASVGVDANAALGLQKLGSTVTAGDFTGGGALVLGQQQTLTVDGTVSGTTTVGIGGIFNGHSQTLPNTQGHTYIDAAGSEDGSFTLATYASRPDIQLVRDENGAWTAVGGNKSDKTIANDFELSSVVVEPDNYAELPIRNVQFAPNSQMEMIEFVPLAITVNGIPATGPEEDEYKVDSLGLILYASSSGDEPALCFMTQDLSQNLTGTYLVSVTVPASHSGTGQPITRTATLTVKAAGGADTPIPVPTANTELVYNGQEQVGVPLNAAYVLESGDASAADAGSYTATVKPADGFTWEDNSTDAKTISWSIARADNFDFPAGLGAAAPSTYGAADGKLTGTTAEMEFSTDEDFTSPVACTAAETIGLQAGDYYVRIAESTNYKAGPAVSVTVPQGPVTVTSIAISTPAAKTAYKVGEPLDVTGLTLTVVLSDGSTSEVSVNPGMVTGFSSSSAAPSQTLTVTYGGQTTTYPVSITEDSSSGGDSGDSGNTGGGSTGGGSTGGSSTGGGGTSGADTGTTTVKNPDGSTTTTTTDKATGTVTATTKYPDGTTTSVFTDKDGKTQTQVKLSDAAVKAAQMENEAVSLPIPAVNAGVSGDAPVVEIGLPRGTDAVKVEIPVKNAAPGVVAVVVDQDGTETAVKKSAVTRDGVTLALSGSVTVKLVDNSAAFSDVPATNWAKNAVDFVSARGIFNGTGDHAFSPDNTMTRGMLAVVLHNLEDSPAHAFDGTFADVEESWYTDAVHWAAERGIVTGYGDGRYGPNDAITREQLAVILWRYAGSPAAEGGELPFADADQVSGYAAEALRWAKEQGIVNGDGNGRLMPKGLTTRAQAAQMLMNFIQTQF